MKWIIIITMFGLTPELKSSGPIQLMTKHEYSTLAECRTRAKMTERDFNILLSTYGTAAMIAAHCEKA